MSSPPATPPAASAASPSAPPSSAPAPREVLLLAALAALATAPTFAPDALGYVDNAPHLLETVALAEALREGRGYPAWSDLALGGFAVHQLNAPLLWVPLAVAVAFGAPVVPLYMGAVVVSNVVFALGALALGRRLFADPRAAWLGAALAAVWPNELWSIGGAAAGMWPWRMGMGFALAGIAATDGRPRLQRDALWLALTLLTHTFSGIVAFGWTAWRALWDLGRGARADAAVRAAAIALAIGLAGFFWLPLLDPRVREFFVVTPWKVLDIFLLLFTGADPYPPVPVLEQEWIGRGWGVVPYVAAVVGFGALAVRRRRGGAPVLADRGLALRASIALAVVLVVAVACLLGNWNFPLGPVPWRYFAFFHAAAALVAGAGLAGLLPRAAHLPVGAALAATAVLAGLAEVGAPWDAERASLREALHATWDDLAAARPAGRVYHEDSAADFDAPKPLQSDHAGPLLTLRHGLPTLGTWYGITPVQLHAWTGSEHTYIMGLKWKDIRENPELLYRNFQMYGVGSVVTVTPLLRAFLAADPRLRLVADHPPFAAYVLVEPVAPPLAIPPGQGTIEIVEARADLVRARVALAAPQADVRLRQGWHPWWEATLDGAPVPVRMGEKSGLVEATLTEGGLLELRWRRHDAGGVWVSAGALLLVVGLAARGRGAS